MKIVATRSLPQSDSSESYGHEFRLKYRKECGGWGGEQRSRRISQQKKERLITMVTKENYRIKEAGRLLGISYSTAKKIFTNFRMELRAKKDSDTGDEEKHLTCLYQEVPQLQMYQIPKIQLVSSIAGEMQAPTSDIKLFNKP